MSNSDSYDFEECEVETLEPDVRYHLTHHTKSVPVNKWVEVILSISPDKISDWSTRLSHGRLLHPSTSIMKNLKKYCEATQEIDQRISWSLIVNEIVSLAPDFIPDIPVFSLPIIFSHNSPSPEDVRSRHVPDVAILPKSLPPGHQQELNRQEDDEWCQVLGCVAFTSGNQDQLEILSHEALRAGLTNVLKGFEQPEIVYASEYTPCLPSDPPLSVDDELQTRLTSTAPRKRKATSNGSSSDINVKRLRADSESSELSPINLPQRETGRLVSHALCLLSLTSGTRGHCLQFLVDGHRLMFWYYDAGGILHSEWMDWIDNFPKFAAIMVAFASLDIRGWGVGNIPNLRPPPCLGASTGPLPSSLSGFTLTMTHRSLEGITQQVKVTLQNKVFTSQSLVGRRTHVYNITTEPEISKKPLVLKMSMQSSDRTPENEFIERATNAGVAHIPEMYMWSNRDEEWRLSDGVWGNLFPDNEDHKVYEDRYQRLIVFTKYEPVERIISPANMHNLMMQLVDCIHELRYKTCILHRDISLGNLMYEELRDGSIKLILNDFDLAVKVDKDGLPTTTNSSKHRTGTLPFMPHELLNPQTLDSVTHSLRHDFESVFLVALWLAIKFFLRDGHGDVLPKQDGRDILYGWEYGTLADIYPKKFTLITDDHTMKGILTKVDMGAYNDWIAAFWAVIRKAYKARAEQMPVMSTAFYLGEELPQQMVDLETFDGLISRNSIKAVLQRWEIAQCTSQTIEEFVPYFV